MDRLADLVPPPRKHGHRSHGVTQAKPRGKAWCSHGRQQHATHELLISRAMREEVPSAGLSFTAQQCHSWLAAFSRLFSRENCCGRASGSALGLTSLPLRV
ncbi:MAG: hypothetical protein ISQ70_02760 [Pirellulales bacterium]|nr:hypothetical protein [Pirellulales bacterium]